MYALKLFRVNAGNIRIRSKETLRIMDTKYSVLDMIQVIRFWILAKKRNTGFQVKNPDSDFSKETHPKT